VSSCMLSCYAPFLLSSLQTQNSHPMIPANIFDDPPYLTI
jgi:hypothetical protein